MISTKIPGSVPSAANPNINVMAHSLPLPYRNSFTAEGKHAMSSDDESDAPTLALCSQRKRRKTFAVPPKPLSPRVENSDDDSDSYRAIYRRRRSLQVPPRDIHSRQRCFDYLMSGIDAVWAEFCDSTSHAEEQMYMPCSPVSDGEELHGSRGSVSKQPQSMRLVRLKERLLDAKYYMSDLVNATDFDSSAQFWKRWDSLKYSIAELVEGENEDEEHEEVLEDLEMGRHYV